MLETPPRLLEFLRITLQYLIRTLIYLKLINIGLIYHTLLHAMALVTFSLDKIVGNLFHSLVTDGINHAAQGRYFHKSGKIVYIRDSINNLSLLSYHFLTYDSKRKNLLTTLNWKKKHPCKRHSRNSLNDSRPWNLSANSFQTKCLLLPDNEFNPNKIFNAIKLLFITICYTLKENSIWLLVKCFASPYLTTNKTNKNQKCKKFATPLHWKSIEHN